MKASFIWFDMGYTLVYMQRETTYQQALLDFGIDIPIEVIEKEFHLTDKQFMKEYPGIFLKNRDVYMPWYLGTMNYRLGLSLNLCEIDALWKEIKEKTGNYWLAFDGVHQVMDELKSMSTGLGIISNWDHTARDILNQTGLSGYFNHFVISGEVGYAKPDPEIFKIALKKAGVNAEDCLYVGDNYYDDILGSRKVKMNALIVNRFGNLGIEEIEDCTIINHISQILEIVR